MVKLNTNEWERMKRPVYPDIQFVSDGNSLQIQTMVNVSTTNLPGKEMYFLPYIKVTTINNIKELEDFILDFKLEVINKVDNYVISEEDKQLFKVEDNDEE